MTRFACLALLWIGCQTGADVLDPNDGGRDAAIAIDSGSTPDAGAMDSGQPPEDGYWTLEMASFDVIDERCSAVDSGVAILRVTVHASSSCDQPGPIYVDTGLGTIGIHPTAWRHHPEAASCTTAGATWTRDAAVYGLTMGTWNVDDTLLAVTVDPRGPLACTAESPVQRGDQCYSNCDCDVGLACVAIRGDAACAYRCEEPCSIPLDGVDHGLGCASDSDCRFVPDVGDVCVPRTASACTAGDCRLGTECTADGAGNDRCAWSAGFTGGTCTSDRDCAQPGYDCVAGPGGGRSCQIRCESENMACPSQTSCGRAALVHDGTCAWVGE